MSIGISSMFGHLPGMGTVIETFEQAYTWGPYPRYYVGAYISSSTADPTNSPTWELRMGLVMAKQFSTGQWINYSATGSDGANIAQGVLPLALRMQDVLTGTNTTKFYAIMASGGVKGANLIGLDLMARQQMSANFIFDDDLIGRHNFPWQQFQSKTAAYQILATDNGTLFDNVGAIGAVTFTLPALANGYLFGFRVVADQTITIASTAGNDIIAFNDAQASSLAFSTGGSKVGGFLTLFSNPGATAWIAVNGSMGANTITVV